MTWSKLLIAASFMFATASIWACGDDPPPAEDPCPKDDPNTDIDESECAKFATESAGETALDKRGCKGCHGDDMSGRTQPLAGKTDYEKTLTGLTVKLYPPNLTNDDNTGIGKWADDDLVVAIRDGYDKESLQLCPQMTHYKTMSDFEAYSIVKYLRSLPVVKKDIPRSICPPTKQEGQ